MQGTGSNRKKGAIVAFTVFVVALAAAATPASAGTYTVHQCHRATGAGTAGWSWTSVGWPYGVNNQCPYVLKLEATNRGAGTASTWTTPELPGALQFDGVNFVSESSNGGGQTNPTARFCTPGPVWNGMCSTSNAVEYLNSASTPQSINLGCSRLGWRCKQFQAALKTAGGNNTTALGHFYGYNFSFTVNDPTAPNAWPPHHGALRSSYNTAGRAWNAGSRDVGYYGSDYDSGGVARVEGFADGDVQKLHTVFPAACDNNTWQPCPDFHPAVTTIDTTGLSDGQHTLTNRATDVGGMSTDASVVFFVDNTAPDVPGGLGVTSAVSGGWQATNDFDLAWSNGSEVGETDTHSGIGSVKVDVKPVDAGAQADPPPVVVPVGSSVGGIAATVESVSGVTVPAKGRWTVTVSVIDRVGNESAAETGGPAEVAIGWDDTPPAAPQGQNNGWISRQELADGFIQRWNSPSLALNAAPICGYAASVNNEQHSDPGTSITLPGAVNWMQLPTNLTEGVHWVHLRSVTCAGLVSPSTENVQAPVDATDPEGAIEGVSEGGWYNHDVTLRLTGFDALSGMAGEPDLTIPADNGAYLMHSLDGVDGQLTRGGIGTASVSAEALHEVTLSPVDFAGNKAKPVSVRFGIDRTAPAGAFDAGDPDRPTLLSAPVGDSLSGIASAHIQVRNQNGGDWITLATTIGPGDGSATTGYPNATVLTARFPDTKLPRGVYDVRAVVEDRATNELVMRSRVDGSPMTISNPVRRASTLSAGLLKARRTCGKRKGVLCVKRHRGKVVFVGAKQRLSVGFKRGAVVAGVLSDGNYGRLGNQPLEIYTKAVGKGEQLAGRTSTARDGGYSFKLPPGTSRVVRVHFPGTERIEDASASVQLGTAAKVGLKLSRRHAYTGQTVRFSGSVRSFDGTMPASGKIVVLQFYAARKWRPAVAVAHTDAKGRFSVKYKFDGPRVKNRIVFRVLAPAEDGWVHTASASKRVTMRLN